MRTAGDELTRALQARGACHVLASSERPWASATFSGARHSLRLALASAGFLDGIEESSFDLGDHLLADLEVNWRVEGSTGLIASIEALTIERGSDGIGPSRAFGRG